MMTKAVSGYPFTHVWFCFPEDLGLADRGMPASILRLPEVRPWANKWGRRRYAVHQCSFGAMDCPLPLGVLSSQPFNQAWFPPGWPRLNGTLANILILSRAVQMSCWNPLAGYRLQGEAPTSTSSFNPPRGFLRVHHRASFEVSGNYSQWRGTPRKGIYIGECPRG